MKETKNKNIAALLAFFGGIFGLHRFYLGEKGRGFVMIFLTIFTLGFLSALISLIDTIKFFSMSADRFDHKYNEHLFDRIEVDPEFSYKSYGPQKYRSTGKTKNKRDKNQATNPSKNISKSKLRQNIKTHRDKGIAYFKDYDFEEAIEEFHKALELDAYDVASNFNIACAYSQIENADKAMYHISMAIEAGFDDLEKIKTHEKLAYARIQPEWEDFVSNHFTYSGVLVVKELENGKKLTLENTKPPLKPSEEEYFTDNEEKGDLLENLKNLKDLRERGLITEIEFELERRKLMSS